MKVHTSARLLEIVPNLRAEILRILLNCLVDTVKTVFVCDLIVTIQIIQTIECGLLNFLCTLVVCTRYQSAFLPL